ncbi:hypothetical protein LY625_12885 [Lysobacter sp. GX 14042]|uniref:hypothetical protein n=1 Tax=Lysobacter sp. GX 14042 TaxID=2907155 RepID=UPI001F2FC67E|nr:hypothetical protein [Lysobacter sp. GX 14042]MCE7033496.1 hypothetical protein [Lysobacter sp. GX 14042]
MPTEADFPISVDQNGDVVSRYGDPFWDLSWLAGHPLILDFGIAPSRRDGIRLSAGNSALLKRIMAYYMYGDRGTIVPKTLRTYLTPLRKLCRVCDDSGILVSDLARYPAVIEKARDALDGAKKAVYVSMLFELYNVREVLGFVILSPGQLKEILSSVQDTPSAQFPYIPPRLWVYQVSRCRQLLEEFNERSEDIRALYDYCLELYRSRFGSLAEYYEWVSRGGYRETPFQASANSGGMSFGDAARMFGVADVLDRWVTGDRSTVNTRSGVRLLSKYFGGVQLAGCIYLASFSGMRASEVARLRADCLTVDHDERVGDIYLLRGATSKTIEDDNAIWITSPTSRIAIDAMASVARMRMMAASADPNCVVSEEDKNNPYLLTRSYEPWAVARKVNAERGESIRKALRYSEWRVRCPGLFAEDEIRLTAEDLQAALAVTPSLNKERYVVGRAWEFSMHQLRRTLNVNATHSGLVSLPSLQYEMKHQTSAMSLYYGQGYGYVGVNRAMTTEFLEAMFQGLALRASSLLGEEFVSPLGAEHKDRVVEFISQRSARELLSLAKKGQLSIRETLLGVCLNRDYCPYGGIDHVAECVRCDKALFSRGKRDQVKQLCQVLTESLRDAAPTDLLLNEALHAQHGAATRALEVLDAK